MGSTDVRKFEYNLHANLIALADSVSRRAAANIEEATKTKVTVRQLSRGMESIANELVVDGKVPASVIKSMVNIRGKDMAKRIAAAISTAMKDSQE